MKALSMLLTFALVLPGVLSKALAPFSDVDIQAILTEGDHARLHGLLVEECGGVEPGDDEDLVYAEDQLRSLCLGVESKDYNHCVTDHFNSLNLDEQGSFCQGLIKLKMTNADCPADDWTYHFHSKKCYKFFGDKSNLANKTWWRFARADCVKRGGELASVPDKETKDFLQSLIDSNAWIGAYRVRDGENEWAWMDGTPWDYSNWNVQLQQPDDAMRDGVRAQDMVSMESTGLWRDRQEQNFGYICQYVPRKEPSNLYKFFDIKKTWNDARDTCEKEGGQLAVILDKETHDFLVNLYLRGREGCWVGGFGAESGSVPPGQKRNWKWIDGSQWSYANWAPREPGNTHLEDKIGLHSTGLFDSYATVEKTFICQWKVCQDTNDRK